MIHKNSLLLLHALLDFSYFCDKLLIHLFQHAISACLHWCPGMLPRLFLAAWESHFKPLHNLCLVAPIWIPELVIDEAVPASQASDDFSGLLWSTSVTGVSL